VKNADWQAGYDTGLMIALAALEMPDGEAGRWLWESGPAGMAKPWESRFTTEGDRLAWMAEGQRALARLRDRVGQMAREARASALTRR
jgi:hypothetical protein